MTLLRRNIAWAAAGNAVYLACQYGMLMAVAKLGSQAAVGQFALALAIAAPIIIFSQMQLRQLQVTDVHGEAAFADYLWTRITTSAAALLFIVAVSALFRGDGTAPVIVMVGVAKTLESISDIAHGRLQRFERLDIIAGSMMVKGLASLAVFALALRWTGSVVWAVTGMAAVWAVVLVALDLPAQRLFARRERERTRGFRLRPAMLLGLTRTAAPLALTSGLISLSGNMPRYFLDTSHGKEAVALFAVAAAPLVLASLLSGAVAQAMLPRAATYYQTGRLRSFRQLAIVLTLVQVGFGAAGAVVFRAVGDPLLSILFTPEYAAAAPLMTIMFLGVALGGFGAFGSLALSAGRHFALQFYNVLFMVLLQVPICWAMIPSYSVIGAAWAEVLRFGTSAAFLLVAGVLAFRSAQRATGPEGEVAAAGFTSG